MITRINKKNKITQETIVSTIEKILEYDYLWYELLSKSNHPELMLSILGLKGKQLVRKDIGFARKYIELCEKKASITRTLISMVNGKQEKSTTKRKNYVIKTR